MNWFLWLLIYLGSLMVLFFICCVIGYCVTVARLKPRQFRDNQEMRVHVVEEYGGADHGRMR